MTTKEEDRPEATTGKSSEKLCNTTINQIVASTKLSSIELMGVSALPVEGMGSCFKGALKPDKERGRQAKGGKSSEQLCWETRIILA